MNDTHCKISAATLARTAALALALTNQVLSACGKPMLPIESATVETGPRSSICTFFYSYVYGF